jgi:hypothetical protein
MSLENDMSIMSGRELQERLLKNSDESTRIRLLVECCIRQQQEMFYLNKKMIELGLYLDKMADTMANAVSGTSALSAEMAPLLGDVIKTNKSLRKNEALTND